MHVCMCVCVYDVPSTQVPLLSCFFEYSEIIHTKNTSLTLYLFVGYNCYYLLFSISHTSGYTILHNIRADSHTLCSASSSLTPSQVGFFFVLFFFWGGGGGGGGNRGTMFV